jgi:small-conductance mechanosensitive channel
VELVSDLTVDSIQKLAGSLLALVLVLAVRFLLARALYRRVEAPELRRRWLANIRNTLFLLFVLAIVAIWADTIEAFAVSLTVVAVAVVIATKELLMCLLGSIVRAGGDSFTLGDRVEIGTFRGDVVHQNLLTTVLLELASGTASQQHTGRTITLPNSVFLTTAVTKESSATPYSLHVFVVPVRLDDRLEDHVHTLLDAANAACAPFLEDVRRHWTRLASLHEVTGSSPDPHVDINLTYADQVDLSVRIPSPTGRQADLQEAIVTRFLATSGAERRVGEHPA